MPEERTVSARGGQRGDTGRGLADAARAPIRRGESGRGLSDEPHYTGPVNVPTINQQALSDYVARSLGAPYYFPNQQTSVTPTQPQGTFYGTDNPYAILSDVFRNVFGSSGDQGRQQQTGQALVPVTSTSGGGVNPIFLLLILGAVGFGVYYFFIRKKAQQ